MRTSPPVMAGDDRVVDVSAEDIGSSEGGRADFDGVELTVSVVDGD